MEAERSHVHLDPEALNVVLAKFVNKPGELEASFVDGHLQVKIMGLLITLQALVIDTSGCNAQLSVLGEAKP